MIRGELEHPAEIAPGYVLRWDPAQPRRCGALTLPAGSDPALRARIAAVVHSPWLRLAAVVVLDRQLYLPLDRSLLNAELAAARLDAAYTFDHTEPARELLIEQALTGARAAADGVVTYLTRLAERGRRPLPALVAGLDPVARAYAELAQEVREFDGALTGVGEAWHEVRSLRSAEALERPVVTPAVATPTVAGASLLDPRSLRARLLRFGPTPDTAEIGVEPVDAGTGPAVRVRVEAFPDPAARTEPADVAVRLVDCRSGTVLGYGVLGWPAACAWAPGYEGVVTLPEPVSVSDVRVDVFEMPGDPGPADSCALRRVRRATLFQSAWRELVADVRLWGARAEPAARVCAIARQIADDEAGADEPLWSRGPSRAELVSIAERGDRDLVDRLGAGSPDIGSPRGAERIVAAVSGPGDLLAAEIAAAYDRSRPHG